MISVLDTSAFSAAMRHEPEMVSFLGARPPGAFAVVPPVVAEIEYGLHRLDRASRRYRLLAAQKERLLSTIPLLDWIPAASVQFGAIKAGLEQAGMMIEDFDIAVAANGPRPRSGSDYRQPLPLHQDPRPPLPPLAVIDGTLSLSTSGARSTRRAPDPRRGRRRARRARR